MSLVHPEGRGEGKITFVLLLFLPQKFRYIYISKNVLPLEPFRAVGQCLDGGGAMAERRFAVFPSIIVSK